MTAKRYSVEKNNRTDWKNFVALCSKFNTSDHVADLFELFLTRAEQDDIAMRYRIVRTLLTGKKTQRQIAKDLSVSIAKITRGSNALKIAPEKTKNLFRK